MSHCANSELLNNKPNFNGGRKGEGSQGTRIKDPWTKPKWDRIEGGGWRKVAGKWR